MEKITQIELKERLYYHPNSGDFVWVKNRKNTEIGKLAGYYDDGYLTIRINNKLYYGHRLAWLYMKGYWPIEVDHKNLNRSDNSWENLREANRFSNNSNCKIRAINKCGLKGVSWSKSSNMWRMDIKAKGERYHSLHTTKEEAKEAYDKAALKLHKEFARF